MAARKYSMQRREAAVEATRRRLVEATVALHKEKGALATTMQDIAARADVALGTAYRHFPTIGDAVFACGARLQEMMPFPSVAVFDGATSPRERLRILIGELFRYYDLGARWWEVGYGERSALPALDQGVGQLDAQIAALVDAAIGPLPVDARFARTAHGLSQFYAWKALSLAGMSTEEAIELVAEILCDRATPAEGEASRPKGRNNT
jgi:AcrR family transcriptional regulator